MELNQIIRDIEEVDKVEKVTEVIEDIEEIAQRLASLYVSMKILATHVNRRNRSSFIRRIRLLNMCSSRRCERSTTKY